MRTVLRFSWIEIRGFGSWVDFSVPSFSEGRLSSRGFRFGLELLGFDIALFDCSVGEISRF